jgi:Hpt domain
MGELQDKDADVNDFAARFEALRLRYMAGLPGHRDGLAEAWHACAGGADDEAWRRLRDLTHRLSGSAPCYGLDRVGELARQLDKLLSGPPPRPDPAAAAPLIERLLTALDAIVRQA